MIGRLLKFLHDLGAIGLTGALLALLVLLAVMPEPAAIAGYAAVRQAMRAIADWLFLPSLGLVIVSGLFALAANQAYMNSGWALTKLATGIIIFEGGLVGVNGPMRREAERAAKALADNEPLAIAGGTMHSETLAVSVLLVVAAVNVALAVWRPRFRRRTGDAKSDPSQTGTP